VRPVYESLDIEKIGHDIDFEVRMPRWNLSCVIFLQREF